MRPLSDDDPPGTPVVVTLDSGETWRTTTRSHAWELGHGERVVLLTGKSGGYKASRCQVEP